MNVLYDAAHDRPQDLMQPPHSMINPSEVRVQLAQFPKSQRSAGDVEEAQGEDHRRTSRTRQREKWRDAVHNHPLSVKGSHNIHTSGEAGEDSVSHQRWDGQSLGAEKKVAVRRQEQLTKGPLEGTS